jgi:(p)ppGpp synthase/HD superfamily hydrolase
MTSKLFNALEFAAFAHDGQKRADNITPYIAHPFSVGLILLEHGFSEEVVIAGILHDVVEDTKYTLEDIEKKFGQRVAQIVQGVTEDKQITSKEERFKFYLSVLKKSDNEVKAVRAADMLHNRRSVLKELDNKFNIWQALHTDKEKYLKESYSKLEIIKETLNGELVSELEKTIIDIKNYPSSSSL